MYRCVFLLVLCLSAMVVVISPLSAQFAGGDGTEESPFLVEDADQLDYVRNYPEAYFRQIDDIDLINYTGGDGWEPISNFSGGYFGNGYSITNLVINLPNDDYVGLFGYVEEAVIGGVKIIEAVISGRDQVGSLVGSASGSDFYLSCSSGTVTGRGNVGGLIGYHAGGVVVESYSTANLSGELNIGGLIGNMNNVTTENCYSLGEVDGVENIGGLIGFYCEKSTVINCYSSGGVSGTVNAGGLIGEGKGKATNSYWDEDSSGLSTSAGGEGRTTSEMTYPYSANTYVDWDFTYLWLQDQDQTNYGYPFLFRAPGDIIPWPIFSGGDGTVNNPFLVEFDWQLNWIRHSAFINRNFLQIADISLDAYQDDGGWLPIGTPSIPFGNVVFSDGSGNLVFTSSYNGNDQTIYDMHIDRPSEHLMGLFGYIYGSKVTNLNIVNSYNTGNHLVGGLAGAVRYTLIENIASSGTFQGNGNFVGGLIGSCYYSTVSDCSSNGTVTGLGTAGGLIGTHVFSETYKSYSTSAVTSLNNQAGGLIGTNMASSLINKSHSSGNVSGNYFVGGLAGQNSQSVIEYSHSTGIVEGNTDTGGLVGLNMTSATIEYSYSTGSVTGEERVGGLAGTNSYAEIKNSYNTGHVGGELFVGGLVGRNDNSLIENSYSMGNVSGLENIGGLIGFNFCSSVLNSYYDYEFILINNNNIITIGGICSDLFRTWLNNELFLDINNYLTYTVDGYLINSVNDLKKLLAFGQFPEHSYLLTDNLDMDNNPGLYIPYLAGNFDGNSYIIENINLDMIYSSCTGAFGYVTEATINNLGIKNASITGIDFVGGLIGFSYVSNVGNCFSTGNITGNSRVGGLIGSNYLNSSLNKSFSTANIWGSNQYCGGLVGYNRYNSTIMDCYATGEVRGDSEVGGLVGMNYWGSVIGRSYSIGKVDGNSYAGGLLGRNIFSSVGMCYWDVVTSQQTESAGGGGVTGVMTVDMVLSDALYSNWDFQIIWDIREFTTYPYLQWQGAPGIHNYPPNGYHKIFSGNLWYWESFPVLWNRGVDGTQDGREVLDPLTYQSSNILVLDEYGDSIIYYNNEWYGQVIHFHSTRGYKLGLYTDDEYYLTLEGDSLNVPVNTDFDTPVALHPQSHLPGVNQYNYVGYFLPQAQCIFNALDEIIDDVIEIRSEDWSLFRNEFDEWEYDVNIEPKALYGKMYKLLAREDLQTTVYFEWNMPTEPEYWIPRPEPEFFVFEQKADYESFFIEYIEGDEDVLEVGVYADNDCVGATVFQGGYPFEIQAYTDESHSGAQISFVIHRSGQRSGPEVIKIVEVRDNQSGEYSLQILRPLRQRNTVVRLSTGDGEVETVVKPELVLYQNYPNPAAPGSSTRSNPTVIPFYVSEKREITLNIYNIKGQLVRQLFCGTAAEGRHAITWDGMNEQNRPAGSSIYFYRLESEEKVLTKKMLLIR